eukprot:Hpha_TRINITY_DN5746_c0_g2::TRINITY_DN5746_c0_g2_i1::g.147546::m.147546
MEQETGEGTMRACWAHCSNWILRNTDRPEDIHIKRGFTPVALVLIVIIIAQIVQNAVGDTNYIFLSAMVMHLVSFTQFLARGVLAMDMELSLIGVFVLSVLASLLQDLHAASALSVRVWFYVIPLLDFALVFNVARCIPGVLSLTLLYLLFERAEAALRFGVYEAIDSSAPPVCDCAE